VYLQHEESLVFECPPIPICGDIKIEFYEKETFGSDQKLLSFWFNTSFVIEDLQNPQCYYIEIPKEDLDKAHKDKQCKTFKENFKVSCTFQSLDTTQKSRVLQEAPLNELAVDERGVSTISPAFEERPKSASMTVLIDNLDTEIEVLNQVAKCNSTSRDAEEISRDLLKQIIEVLINLDPDGEGLISSPQLLSELRYSNQWREFSIATAELQQAQLDKISPESRLSFWINVYNLLAIHANARFDLHPTSLKDYIQFSRKAKYQIGSFVYSLLEIEYIILKSKLKVPQQIKDLKLEEFNQIGSSDPRWSFGISKADPRINFLLSIGTVDSPPITIIYSNCIFDQLERATRNFLQGMTVNKANKEILVPSQLSWWYQDFAKKKEKVLKSLVEYLSPEQKIVIGEKYQLHFKDYNWIFQYSFSHFVINEYV